MHRKSLLFAPARRILIYRSRILSLGMCAHYKLNPAELSNRQYHTAGLNRHGTLKHDYPANEWRLVPLRH